MANYVLTQDAHKTNKNRSVMEAVIVAGARPEPRRRCRPRLMSALHARKSSRREWKPRRGDAIMTLRSDRQPDPGAAGRLMSKGHVIADHVT